MIVVLVFIIDVIALLVEHFGGGSGSVALRVGLVRRLVLLALPHLAISLDTVKRVFLPVLESIGALSQVFQVVEVLRRTPRTRQVGLLLFLCRSVVTLEINGFEVLDSCDLRHSQVSCSQGLPDVIPVLPVVILDLLDGLLLEEVVVEVVYLEGIFAGSLLVDLVDPFQSIQLLVAFRDSEVGQRAHLRVDEGVSKDQLFRSDVRPFVRQLVPLRGEFLLVEFLLQPLLVR